MFHVTGNLEAAMKHIRDPYVEKYLWVDALCINQADNIEKSSQFLKMAKIFGEAANVRV